MNPTPTVSVVMPVYNAQAHVHAAVASILAQTLSDFEFIIIDDGSYDDTPAILDAFTDPRIWRITHTQNSGLIASLNEGFSLAKGRYIARMDADDLSKPSRFASQVAYLEERGADICGCHFTILLPNEKAQEQITVPLAWENVVACLANTVPFAHGSVMLRKSFLQEQHLQYDAHNVAEDYDLWSRMYSRGARFGNVNEPLFVYRNHSTSLSKTKAALNASASKRIRRDFVSSNLADCAKAFTLLCSNLAKRTPQEEVNALMLGYRTLRAQKEWGVPLSIKIWLAALFRAPILVQLKTLWRIARL